MGELCGYEASPIESDSEEDEDGWCSELDHVPLIQRRELLLANRANITETMFDNNGVIEPATQQCGLQMISLVEPIKVDQFSAGVNGFQELGIPSDCSHQEKMNTNSSVFQTSHSAVNIDGIGLEKLDARIPNISQNMMIETPPEIKIEDVDNVPDPSGDIMPGSLGVDMQAQQLENNDSFDCTDDLDNLVLRERLKMLPPSKMVELAKPFQGEKLVGLNVCSRLDFLPACTDNAANATLKVKSEPSDDVLENIKHNAAHDYPFSSPHVKIEPEIMNAHENMVDHVQQGDKMKIPTIGEDSELKNFDFYMRTVHTGVECGPTFSETPRPPRNCRPRKRKKTATDSVEIALEEDAPGLLQVLIGEGISVDEIKLYGEAESDELIVDSFPENEFLELESVISKLFFRRNSLLKLTPLQCPKGSKPIYSLGCLFSLVEQTRYLRFRNWPAEWGWCRDLQSFIFVFERHRRIVLERPEYGYATYFFELVDSLPIDWQIKRLVTAMKLSSCGRITLVENKALMVGEDLTEGEAQVLMQFGWIPNSGLGTMLNYCDRVVHDRKNDKESSEWRSKIGKLLVNGYNGGSIVSNNIEVKTAEQRTCESFETKVEL